MTREAERLIELLAQEFAKMSDEERIDCRIRLFENYCEFCGTKFLPCHCTNDE